MSRLDYVMDNIELNKSDNIIYFGIDWGHGANANGDVFEQEALKRSVKEWLKEHGVSEVKEGVNE